MKILVTGGCGFIGTNFIRYTLQRHPEDHVVNLDLLTYAGNEANLEDVVDQPNYQWVQGDIADADVVVRAMAGCDAVVNFAAESHVDRSIVDATAFLHTNVQGVYTLLEAARREGVSRFLQISTDEVYGPIAQGSADESAPLRPSNPYSASKAAGELLAYSYWVTFQLPVLITRSANNFGPYQFPEKAIPLFITNALEGKSLPLYGDGQHVRDWLYVEDNCAATDLVLRQGAPGETYNIGGHMELTNRSLAEQILKQLNLDESLIQSVADRPGHDRRYSLDSSKVAALGWSSHRVFGEALDGTLQWYREHDTWWRTLKSRTASGVVGE